MEGIVMRSTGAWYTIRDAAGNEYRGRVRGKFRLSDKKLTNPVAVGDRVRFEPRPDEQDIVDIVDILPRENYLIRKAIQKKEHAHILASNIDQAVPVVTHASPRTSTGFIDRCLVSLETFRIPAVLVFNKQDLLSEDEKVGQKSLADCYEAVGYTCLFTSAETGTGIEQLKETLTGKKTLIFGHSGVGKSSLINIIAPDLNLRTADISAYTDKGTHTTTFAEMHVLFGDTFIIDTPGIKELGLAEVEKGELAHFFPEMRALMQECRFNNCLHVREPGCAVLKALQEEKICESRYANYLNMLEEIAS